MFERWPGKQWGHGLGLPATEFPGPNASGPADPGQAADTSVAGGPDPVPVQAIPGDVCEIWKSHLFCVCDSGAWSGFLGEKRLPLGEGRHWSIGEGRQYCRPTIVWSSSATRTNRVVLQSAVWPDGGNFPIRPPWTLCFASSAWCKG